MNKKILIALGVVVVLLSAAAGWYFWPKAPGGQGSCGDGVCDSFEKSAGVCSQDCGGAPGQANNPVSPGTVGNIVGHDVNTEQPPILITFDIHPDPMLGNNENQYKEWKSNIEWLLDLADKNGTKISFLSQGEWMEQCNKNYTECDVLLKRLYESGGMLGTHTHNETHKSFGEWQWMGAPTNDITNAEKVWTDTKDQIDTAIKRIYPNAKISDINSATGSHVPTPVSNLHSLLVKYGFTILEGGPEQVFANYFHHVPFVIWRPGPCELCEDLNAKFVTQPQSMIPGQIGSHGGGIMDGTYERKQAELLQLLANRAIYTLQGKGTRVWTYGWGLHPTDIRGGVPPEMRPGRTELEILLPWIKNNLVDKGYAKFTGIPATRDAYVEWEKKNPGVSSFNYSENGKNLTKTDYARYPYSEITNKYFGYATLAKIIQLNNTDVFILNSQKLDAATLKKTGDIYKLAFILPTKKPATLDLSSVFGSTDVRLTNLSSAKTVTFGSNKVEVGGTEPAIVCVTADCEAVLAMSAGSDTLTGSGKCGDGVCDALEKANPGLCAQDCR